MYNNMNYSQSLDLSYWFNKGMNFKNSSLMQSNKVFEDTINEYQLDRPKSIFYIRNNLSSNQWDVWSAFSFLKQNIMPSFPK